MKQNKMKLKILKKQAGWLLFSTGMIILISILIELIVSNSELDKFFIPFENIFRIVWKIFIPVHILMLIIYIFIDIKIVRAEKELRNKIGTVFKKVKLDESTELYKMLKEEDVYIKRHQLYDEIFLVKVIFYGKKGVSIEKTYNFKEKEISNFVKEVE